MNPEMKDIKTKDLNVLKDQRGWFVELFRQEFGIDKIAQVNLTVAKPWIAKGNHYHLHKTEWYCVIKGKMKLVLKDIDSQEQHEVTLAEDELRIIKIPPRVVHGFKNIGDEDMYLVYCTDTPFDQQEPDTFPEVVIT